MARPSRSYRANLGRGILLGLKFLIAADIIGMVAIVPTFERLWVLGLTIVIRTFLSISFQIEIDGRLPWRRDRADADDPKAACDRQVRCDSGSFDGELSRPRLPPRTLRICSVKQLERSFQ